MNKDQQKKNNDVLKDLECQGTFEVFQDDEAAASLVEYAILVALIAVVCILAITFLGQSTSNALTNPALTNALSTS